MKKYALTLNLKNDAILIEDYIRQHKEIWPEVEASIKEAGIIAMHIYRWGTKLFMIMEVDETFSFEKKAASDRQNKKVQEWEALMWKYQAPVEGANEGEKWVLMEEIFSL
ncbi:L-rhamnose mutarotase [Gynurincola endophyticus]|uniref:L-rhamnose mutarotase n=1 Tax=Gynurincola endophyticus TaxID=2479004 RepID=UPI000F8C5458|nr:L-rhamnose mutarotase [Gynurincola endophyticus]